MTAPKMTESRIPCPYCDQQNLPVEQRADGKFYRVTHGPGPTSLVCRGSTRPLQGTYTVKTDG